MGELPAGGEIEHQPAARECVAYRFDLRPGEAVRFQIDQRGVDVAAVAFDPAGEPSPEVDGLTGAWGIDEGVVVAEVAGEHRLEIRSGRPSAGAAYRLSAEPPRRATEADRLAAEAARRYRAGRELQRREGRESEALAALVSARRLFREAGARRGEAWSLYALGELHKKDDEWAAAERAFRRAAHGYRLSGERHGLLRASLDLARMRRRLGDLDGAGRSARRVLRLACRLGDEGRERSGRAELGHVAYEEGRAAEAIRIYSALLEEGAERLSPDERYDLQVAFGTVYLEAGEPEAALARFAAALEAAEGNDARRAQVLQNRGRALRRLGRWDEAIESLEEARETFAAEENHRELAETVNNLGLLHLDRGQPEEAARLFREALRLASVHGTGSYEASVRVNLAKHAIAVGEPRSAHQHCRRAREVAEASGRDDLRLSAGYCVARSLLALGRLAEAAEETGRYLELAEEVRVGKAHADHRASYQADRRHYFELPVALHLRLDQRRPGEGHADAAFAAAERARMRVLLELLAAAGADVEDGLDSEALRGLATARQEVSRFAGELRREQDERERARLEQRLDRAREELRRRLEESRRAHPAYAELTAPEPVSLDVVRHQVLDDETQLLVYFLGEERSWLWLIDRDGAAVHELPRAAEIEEAAASAVSHLARSGDARSKGRAERTAEALAEQVLAPVAARLDRKRLAIVADGKLHAVPFGALPLPGADGRAGGAAPQLVERFEIVYPASVSVLRAQRRMRGERPSAPATIAILGDPVFDDRDGRLGGREGSRGPTGRGSGDGERICADLRRLPHSGAEAATIAGLAPEAELRTGFAATRGWVLGGGLAGFGRLHFATHACVDVERPELSGIALSMRDEAGGEVDGMLRAHEIYGLRLSAELAVISACSSALGREVRGEGLLGITRGFLYAGVPRVVVSLWDVDDRATSVLMESFYRGLYERGETPAAALTAAQREMAANERWSAPEHWAAFVVQGDWR